MSQEKYKHQLIILPEDKANIDIVNGFTKNQNVKPRAIHVLREAGGWKDVVKQFPTDEAPKMRQYPKRMMLLLIDFDNVTNRLELVQSEIPDDLKDRVFILGSLHNPEQLKRDLGKSFEQIGEALAKDCSENQSEFWGSEYLKHNQPELERMIVSVKPFLFN
ncbi:MAG: hypothetical protein Fur0025_38130 [Oscillatoriaceae cyanobacterium]